MPGLKMIQRYLYSSRDKEHDGTQFLQIVVITMASVIFMWVFYEMHFLH